MATAQTEARLRDGGGQARPRNSRRNEIVAVALFAISAALTLCLLSYSPNDPSWAAEGPGGARNLIGTVGANLAAGLFQFFGLAAALLPVLIAAAGWRRFRDRRIHAPLSRVVGLLTLTLSAASLFALFLTEPLFDRSFNAGGMFGVLVAENLREGLNTVGAGLVLGAAAAVGLLLATNFSFARAYERVASAVTNPSGAFRLALDRFAAWREERRTRAQAHAEMRREARAVREKEAEAEALASVAESATVVVKPAGPAKRAASEYGAGVAAIRRHAAASSDEAAPPTREDEIREQLARAEAELASIVARPSGQTSAQPSVGHVPASPLEVPAPAARRTAPPRTAAPPHAEPASPKRPAAPDVTEMLETAEVVRTEPIEGAAEDPDNVAPPRKKVDVRAETALLGYEMPPLDFLNPPVPRREQADEELLQIAQRVAEKCKEFNVTGQIKHICPGPVVTTYEFKPDPGVKYSRVTGLVDDLCIALEAESVRIDRLPGKPHVGIEVPNPERETIFLREVLESRQFRESGSKLSLALGKTIDGINYVADLTRMPHLLIAGATGTGKSVCLNSLVVSLLYKARPDEVKFIMIDPKRLELGLYADIPHLAAPIITEPKKAANALKWAVAQMEQRYKQLASWGVRNIDGYNAEVERRNNVLDFDDDGNPWKTLPYIVIIIDELADLMMTCGGDVEEAITRLAQMARAVGIHLVLATQRPSVDVITGIIKANFPSRIAFRVSSKVDSRTIIDSNGAEQLLGRGDMLFLPPGTSRLVRVHGAYLDENEVAKVVAHIKAQGGEPAYDETITQSEEEAAGLDDSGGERDELFEQALRICVEMKRASTSVLQRRLRIGYGRAAAILDAMEREGYIGQADGARPRPILGRAFETISHWDDLRNDAPDEEESF
jgi:S-DNA-T family DNA segregation ATPase FtsK/SpoIIIE